MVLAVDFELCETSSFHKLQEGPMTQAVEWSPGQAAGRTGHSGAQVTDPGEDGDCKALRSLREKGSEGTRLTQAMLRRAQETGSLVCIEPGAPERSPAA